MVEEQRRDSGKFGIILYIVLISYFLILLNNSLIFMDSVQISQEMRLNSLALSWVSNAYALTFGGFLSLGARLGDILGRRQVMIWGLLIFSVASLLVAMAPNSGILIAMRAFQGIGSALLAPATLALLMDSYVGTMLTRAIAYYGAMAGIGSVIGLIIGGVIASYASWRVGFYLDVVVGLILAWMAIRYVHAGETTGSLKSLDWWGTITSIIGFSSLVYSLDGTVYRGWAAVIAVITLVLFVLIEARVKVPLMPLEIFKSNERTSALVARFFLQGASMSYFFMMPQALQNGLHYSPLMAALAFVPLTICQFVLSLLVARLTDRFSNTAVLIAGAIVYFAGFAAGALIGFDHGYWLGVALPMLLIGAGQGLIMSPLTVAGVAGTSGDIAGAASGVVNTFQQIGGAVGLAIASLAVAGISSPVKMIDQAQWVMAILAVVTLLSSLNILRKDHA